MSEHSTTTSLASPASGGVAAPARPGRLTALAILVCMCAIYFFSFFQRVAVPGTVFDRLMSEYHTSAAWVAGLSTLFMSIYGVMQFASGALNDRYGATRVILACGLLLTLGSFLFPLAPTLGWLYAARAIVGLGASLAFVSLVKELDYLYTPREFPTYLGLAMFLGYAGGLAGTLPFERAVGAWGWRPSLLAAAVLCAVAVMLAYLLFRRAGSLARHIAAPSPRVFGAILRNRASLPLLLSAPANFAVYFLLQSTIGKKFLADYCGISGSRGATFTFVMMLVTMCIILCCGFFTRLTGQRRKPLLIIAIGFALSGFLLLLWGLHAGLGGGWFLFCYVVLATSNIGSAIGNIIMKELNPPDAVGTATGLINGLCYLTVALLAWLAGLIMDRFRPLDGSLVYPREAYAAIFTLCAAISVGTLICSLFVRETRGQSVYRAGE